MNITNPGSTHRGNSIKCCVYTKALTLFASFSLEIMAFVTGWFSARQMRSIKHGGKLFSKHHNFEELWHINNKKVCQDEISIAALPESLKSEKVDRV